MKTIKRDEGSFRDKSGFVFMEGEKVYRSIAPEYLSEWEKIKPFADYLVDKSKLVPFSEISSECLEVERLPYISYPYEWSFDKLKSAALLTLEIQKEALRKGFILKDASSYNIQFKGNQPIFIDHFSFEPYREGDLWDAYSQFCRHFLAPLVLMAKVDPRLNRLFLAHLDGIPLDLAVTMLPQKCRLSPFLQLHLYLQNKQTVGKSEKKITQKKIQVTSLYLEHLADQLSKYIKSLDLNEKGSEWSDYYAHTSYSDDATKKKEEIVARWLTQLPQKKSCLDIGANEGKYTVLAESEFERVLSIDNDALTANNNFRAFCYSKIVCSLDVDILNMSPGIGWLNEERKSFFERSSADCLLALALIHHLRISGGVPLTHLASVFSKLTVPKGYLILEFVPKEDEMTKVLLANREDIFDDFTIEGFETAFLPHYEIQEKKLLEESERYLYLLKRREEKSKMQ